MSFYDNRCYYFNKLFLSMIGQWPYQVRLEANVTFLLTFLSICSLTVFELWGLISGISDIDIVMENLSLLLVNNSIMIKLINFVRNKHKVKQLLDRIEEMWEALQGNEILSNYAEQSRTLTIRYAVALYLMFFMFAIPPHIISGIYLLLPINGTYKAKFMYRFDHVIDMDKYSLYRGLLILHGIIGVFYIVSVAIAVDCLFVVSIRHSCALFEIMRYNMDHIRSLDPVLFQPNLMDDEAYHTIVNCIKLHKHALEFSELLSSVYATSYLLLLGSVVISLSFSATELTMVGNKLEDIVKVISAIVAQLLHLYYLSSMSQRLIDYSSGLHEVIYSCNWYTISLRSKQLLKFMLLRTTKPCQIKAGKMYVMSMENFSSILRVSMSYFTMLTSFK